MFEKRYRYWSLLVSSVLLVPTLSTADPTSSPGSSSSDINPGVRLKTGPGKIRLRNHRADVRGGVAVRDGQRAGVAGEANLVAHVPIGADATEFEGRSRSSVDAEFTPGVEAQVQGNGEGIARADARFSAFTLVRHQGVTYQSREVTAKRPTDSSAVVSSHKFDCRSWHENSYYTFAEQDKRDLDLEADRACFGHLGGKEAWFRFTEKVDYSDRAACARGELVGRDGVNLCPKGSPNQLIAERQAETVDIYEVYRNPVSTGEVAFGTLSYRHTRDGLTGEKRDAGEFGARVAGHTTVVLNDTVQLGFCGALEAGLNLGRHQVGDFSAATAGFAGKASTCLEVGLPARVGTVRGDSAISVNASKDTAWKFSNTVSYSPGEAPVGAYWKHEVVGTSAAGSGAPLPPTHFFGVQGEF